MNEENKARKQRTDKRLVAPTVAVLVLIILQKLLEDFNMPVLMKIIIRLLPVIGVVWWARVKSKIDNIRNELYKRIFQEAATMTFILGMLVLIAYAQLQREGIVKEPDLTLSWQVLTGAFLIIYFLVRRHYISHA